MAYNPPWRPNFEGAAVLTWLTLAFLAAVLQSRWPLHQAPFQALTLLAAGMTLYRLPGALRHSHRRAKLAGLPQRFLTPAELDRQRRARPGDLWLGWGFDWSSDHAQLALDLIRAGPHRLVPGDADTLGAHWLHGLAERETPVWLPIAHSAGHILIVGTTGAGKTRLLDLLVTQAVRRGEAVVILDPKGDAELQASARQACGDQPGRFVSFHPAFPARSHRLDPLHSFNRATELASRIAAILPSETGNDPFKNFSQMALSHVIGGVLAAGERPNLLMLRRYLEGGVEALVERVLRAYLKTHAPSWDPDHSRALAKAQDTSARARALVRLYQEQLRPSRPSTVIDGLVSLFEHDKVHFSKMVASLFPLLNMLTAGELGPLLSPDSDDPQDPRPITAMARILDRAQVAYIGLDSLSDTLVGSAIGSILIADLAAVAGDRYNYTPQPPPVNVFIDEAAEIVNDPLIQLLNKGRGAGLRLTIATQTFADFAARTGSEAKARQLLANLNTLIALRVLDAETQEYVTASLPKTRLKTLMRTQATSTQRNPLEHSGNVGERLMEEEAELFQPALLGQLPNLHYIARLAGGRLVKGRLPILGTARTPDGPVRPGR
ncbi:conjugative transfer system coupling protein TraD [Allochromatium humboldtianum]|uniref:Conjugative transfer system coupling protein TraD n=1 Tax=Allochromatium humboldtianum TaxID=504901 RepID=A0A850RNL0_9GAMM|nr:conjugative transfer system coupling protein TraD [Allochromatium humboldtianum]NVZ10523.1 conjugative transfer system coupling protein TraD [Allochromatium humboldtianum]